MGTSESLVCYISVKRLLEILTVNCKKNCYLITSSVNNWKFQLIKVPGRHLEKWPPGAFEPNN